MNCVMCEVANISPFSGQPSFEVSVCPHEHYQCVRCDNENQNHCGLCGEGTYLIYLDLRFAAAQSDTASSGNLWQNEDYWDNWPRESWSMVKFRGTYEQSSSSMIAPRYWNPGCRQPIDDLDLGEDSIGQLDEMKAESSSNTSNDLREIWNAKDFKSGLKYFVAKESDIVKGHFYKEQQLILSPLYLHKAESHAIAKKSTTIIGIRALQQGFPSGSHDSKLKSITTISNSFTNSKVMYLEDYTAEEKRLLIGYPNRDKISGGHCLQDDAVKDEKKELFTGEYTSLYRTAERAPTKDQKAYQLEPHVVDHKDIPLSFFRPKEPKKTLQTLFFKNISGTYPTMKGLPLDYFSAVQKHPFSIPKRPVKLLWSEPRSMISSTPRNQLSLVRRVRFGGKNFKGLHSEVVTCPEDLVADLQVLKSRKGKVMLPIPVHGLGRNFQFPKCPDFDCGEYLYSSNMNDHMALLHGNRVVESLELNQPKSFCLDLRSSNRKVRCHAVLQLRNVVNDWGFMPKQDILPILIMSREVNLSEILDNERLKQRLTIIWVAALIADCLPLNINITLWPRTGKSPESIISFTGRPHDIGDILQPIDLIKCGKVIILTEDQVQNLTNDGRDSVGIQLVAMISQRIISTNYQSKAFGN